MSNVNDVLWQVGRIRNQEFRQHLETQQLIEQWQSKRPGRKARLLFNLGDFLVSFGTKLKMRYEPAAG